MALPFTSASQMREEMQQLRVKTRGAALRTVIVKMIDHLCQHGFNDADIRRFDRGHVWLGLHSRCRPPLPDVCRKCGSHRTCFIGKSESRALTCARCEACGYMSVVLNDEMDERCHRCGSLLVPPELVSEMEGQAESWRRRRSSPGACRRACRDDLRRAGFVQHFLLRGQQRQ